MTNKLAITDVVLRDAHQSLFATRMRIDDMLPIAAALDDIGYWSLETWGGATFDACIRYLGEDPWERLRELKKAMPKTPMQMLLRGQNLLGYRHYADDVVDKFVERAHTNGMDVFRVFDAMNDIRNFERAIKAVVNVGGHAQGTISYTTSPVHNINGWVDLARQLEDLGSHSICIKDMAGLLKPYDAQILVEQIKSACDVPVALHCHATTGLSTATAIKAIEAGLDILDTSISSMSQTYGHTPTETVVAMLQETERDTELDLLSLEPISAYFREVRKKYTPFEGQLKGVDSRILTAQVPGGMLTNMESQLKAQGASDKLDDVLLEIPKVREDLGFIPLVTPTSQIVGTQAVINVLMGERYKSIAKETAGVLKGEYGAAPAPINKELQAKVLDGDKAITCRPADLIPNELDALIEKFNEHAQAEKFQLADDVIDDVLTYALLPQVALKFLKNRNNSDAFEPAPTLENAQNAQNSQSIQSTSSKPQEASNSSAIENYSIRINNTVYDVEVGPKGSITAVSPSHGTSSDAATTAVTATNNNVGEATQPPAPESSINAEEITAPLAGTIFKVPVNEGQSVNEGDVLIVLEAMKMETEVRAVRSGVIEHILIKEGDGITVGQPLLTLG